MSCIHASGVRAARVDRPVENGVGTASQSGERRSLPPEDCDGDGGGGGGGSRHNQEKLQRTANRQWRLAIRLTRQPDLDATNSPVKGQATRSAVTSMVRFASPGLIGRSSSHLQLLETAARSGVSVARQWSPLARSRHAPRDAKKAGAVCDRSWQTCHDRARVQFAEAR